MDHISGFYCWKPLLKIRHVATLIYLKLMSDFESEHCEVKTQAQKQFKRVGKTKP